MRSFACRVMAVVLVGASLFGAVAVEPAAGEAAVNYGSFRVIKAVAGAPSQPEIVLPEGYTLVTGANHQVVSRLEYYSFIQGPRSDAVPVTVRWPGEQIDSVVSLKARPGLTRNDDGSVTFPVPVTATSVTGARGTLEIFSFVHRTRGMQFRLEHNHPDRAAGFYATTPWVGRQAQAAQHHQFAAEAVLIDSGLAEAANARVGDFWAVQGFESNNRLHPDNPAHWHLSHVPDGSWSAPRTTIPHFLLDEGGRILSNGMDVGGVGRTNYPPGVPAPVTLLDGTVLATLTVRTDGGLDIDPGGDRPVYSIVAPEGWEDLVSGVEVRRDGQPWLLMVAQDDLAGAVHVHRIDLVQRRWTTTRYRYDAQIGTVRDVVVVMDITAPPGETVDQLTLG